MRMISLEFENFLHHRRRKVDFAPGVNILKGPNGSGKSSIVAGINFGLLGSFHDGTSKDDNLSWGTDAGSVTIEFEHAGVVGTLRRNLHDSGAALAYGAESYRTATTVNKRLLELLAIDADLIENFVLIHQHRLLALLNAGDAGRQRLLHILFGNQRFQKLEELLAKELSATPVIVTAGETPSQLQDQRTGLQAQREELRRQSATLDLAGQAFDAAAARQRLQTLQLNAHRIHHRTLGLEAQQRLKTRLQAESAALPLPDAKYLQRLAEMVDALEKQAVEAQAALTQAARIERDNQRRRTLAKSLADLELQSENRPEPKAPPERSQVLNELRAAVDQLTRQLADHNAFCQGFSRGSCPTCGTVRIVTAAGTDVDIPQTMAARQAAAAELTVRREPLQAQLRQYENELSAYQEQRAAYETWVNQWSNQVQVTCDAIEAAGPEEAAPDVQAAQALLQQLADYRTKRETAQREVTAVTSKKEDLERRITAAAAAIEELESLELGDTESLEQRLEIHQKGMLERARLEGQAAQLDRAIDALEARLVKLRVDLERAANQIQYRAVLSTAREAFGRDNFPAAVGRLYFDRINAGWNKTLELLDVPFTARLNADFSLSVYFQGGKGPLQKASGGQKACAMISFLLEVNRQFAGQAGFMVLDEPTDGIDEEHKDRVPAFLRNAQTYAEAAGMQIIVVSHETKLLQGFESVIDLGVK